MTIHDSMASAVHDLITPWTDIVQTGDVKIPYKPVDHDPMFVTLRMLIRSSTGGTASGASDDAARNVLNLEAFKLWEQITNEVALLTRKHTRDRPNPMLGAAVHRLAGSLDTLWNTHQITEPEYLHAIRSAETWRARIWKLLHKPREKELAYCPACEQTKVISPDGELQAALIAYYSPDAAPTARCRHCGSEWVGEGALIILGKMLGAELDETALTEMGAL